MSKPKPAKSWKKLELGTILELTQSWFIPRKINLKPGHQLTVQQVDSEGVTLNGLRWENPEWNLYFKKVPTRKASPAKPDPSKAPPPKPVAKKKTAKKKAVQKTSKKTSKKKSHRKR